tara:strand:+ start:274 stop:1320 length:1047 start_codon:yes stop_codon:yes gene_type:complete
MAILYSYPTVTPTSADLLIGTSISSDGNENETRTFTIGDIIGLVPAAGTGGTVTRVKLINTDGFVTITNPEVTTAGDITVDLTNNGGTANNTTYYRGDGQWAVPPGTTASHQYTISASNNAPNVDILLTDTVYAGTPTFVKLVNGAGINMSESSNQITVTNTGVNNIVSGTFINVNTSTSGGTAQSPIVDLKNNSTTPDATKFYRGDGTWQTIAAGGTMSSWNLLGDTGTENIVEAESVKIKGDGVGVSVAVADNGGVAEATISLASTTPVTIAAANTSQVYDAANTNKNISITGTTNTQIALLNVLSNSTDSYTSPKVNNIISLTTSEYAALVSAGTTNANTLYIVI